MRMIPGRRKCFLALVFSGVVSIIVYFSLDKCSGLACFKPKIYPESQNPMCRLPRLDPYDESIIHLLSNVSLNSSPICPGIPKVFELVDGWIRPRGNSLPENVLKKSVKYEVIERRDDNGQDDFYYGPEVFIFKSDKKVRRIRSDFVKVSYRLEDRSRRVEMFAQVARKKNLIPEVKKNDLNVILLGFDSTSNANFQRVLPELYKYLVNRLDAFVFNGYSIVGDGTTPALAALLTGIPLRVIQDDNLILDEWPWIMKDYKKKGYVTLYGEDDPQLACFNGVRRGGFHKPPADHYVRPFWLAVEQNGRKRNKSDTLYRVCLNDEPLHNITLNYITKFLRAYKKVPKFAFGFFSYLPHGTGEKLRFAEKDLLLFLRNFEKFRKDSILILFGDHGPRIGAARNTIQGGYEEHLPWLSIVTPPWFKDKYPDFVKNMQYNRDLITTPFDVHHTLKHILELGKVPVGTSLFSRLNPQRSCADAGIDEHWCPCFNWKQTDISSPQVQTAARLMVKHINKVISRKSIFLHLCFTIYLVDVLIAAKAEGGTNSNTYYQVTIGTNPGGGTFQATFHVNSEERLVINSHMSRTNMYGRNPWCLPPEFRSMRKYCTCKKPYSNKRDGRKRS